MGSFGRIRGQWRQRPFFIERSLCNWCCSYPGLLSSFSCTSHLPIMSHILWCSFWQAIIQLGSSEVCSLLRTNSCIKWNQSKVPVSYIDWNINILELLSIHSKLNFQHGNRITCNICPEKENLLPDSRFLLYTMTYTVWFSISTMNLLIWIWQCFLTRKLKSCSSYFIIGYLENLM